MFGSVLIYLYKNVILRSDGKKKTKWKNEKSDLSWKDVIWELREPTCLMLKAPNARELAHF